MLCHVVWQKFTDVSEVLAASIRVISHPQVDTSVLKKYNCTIFNPEDKDSRFSETLIST
jgi:hypothetical protein